MRSHRHFFRCPDCLQRVYVEIPTDRPQNRYNCEACNGIMEWVGILNIRTGNVEDSYMAPPCDQQCVDALGVKCDCKCGGVNHGTHAIVEVVRIAGVSIIKTIPSDEAIQIATEWREAKAKAARIMRPILEKTGFIPYNEFSLKIEYQRGVTKASGYRTHKKRMDVMLDLCTHLERRMEALNGR